MHRMVLTLSLMLAGCGLSLMAQAPSMPISRFTPI